MRQNSITIRKGDTVNLRFTFKDAAGSAIDLTGHTVKIAAVNMYNLMSLFEKSVTSFTGSSNIATATITDEETALFAAGEYRYYVRIETAQGEAYSSRSFPCYVSTKRDTHAEVRGIEISDENILCDIDDVVTIVTPGGSTAPTDISITPSSPTVDEGTYTGLEVATITVNGSPAPSLTLTGADTAGWSIVGNKLVFTGTMDYETKASYSLNINAVNSQNVGNPLVETFVIGVNDVDESPIALADPWNDSGTWNDNLMWTEA